MACLSVLYIHDFQNMVKNLLKNFIKIIHLLFIKSANLLDIIGRNFRVRANIFNKRLLNCFSIKNKKYQRNRSYKTMASDWLP